MTKADFELIMRQLKANYPNFAINEVDTQIAWWAKLKNLRNDYTRIAVKKYTDTERYAPVPADIITRYREVESHNRHLMNDLRDKFNLARQYYPVTLWGENDEMVFMSLIKSKTFNECQIKANKIVEAVKNTQQAEMTFEEFIKSLR